MHTSFSRIERKGSLSCGDERRPRWAGAPRGAAGAGVCLQAPLSPGLCSRSSRTQAGLGATHLLTLVVTDGKFIEDEVPALPALPLENRQGSPWVLGPALSLCQGHAGGIWSTPEPGEAAAQHSPHRPPALPPRAPSTHHVALLHAVAALDGGGPGGRLGGRDGDVALRAPQQRVGGQVAALCPVPSVLKRRARLPGGARRKQGGELPNGKLEGRATQSVP